MTLTPKILLTLYIEHIPVSVILQLANDIVFSSGQFSANILTDWSVTWNIPGIWSVKKS